MSTFPYSIEIGDFEGLHFEPLEALVDTGATYSTIPSDVLDRLGATPVEERRFILANGQPVNYGVSWVRVRIDGREQPTLVIFAPPGSRPLLGAFTLEGFGLMADPLNHRLVPAEAYLVGIVEDERGV